MEWVETTGKTLDEAKDAALDRLGVDEADAELVVLEEPKSGLFGRVRGEARLRARVRPSAPRPKDDRRDRRRRRVAEDSPPDAAAEDETPAPAEERPARARKRAATSEEAAVEATLEEQGEAARAFVEGLVRTFGLDADVVARPVDDETVEVTVTAPSPASLGILIGPKGSTLLALQDLARTAVARRLGTREGRILVDVSGYRDKRRKALARFTEQVAAQVAASGVPRALEPMAAPDRKVVHDTANTLAGVTTTSEGEEPNRRVVVHPEGPQA